MAVVGHDLAADGSVKKSGGKGPSGPSGLRLAVYAAGWLALLLGALLWAVGAWYTLHGWLIGINLVLDVLGVVRRAALPSSWGMWLFVPVGLAYSSVEIYLRPSRSAYGKLYKQIGAGLMFMAFVLWLFVLCTDLGSTYLAVAFPSSSAGPLAKQVAASPWATGAWTIVLTFVPELLGLLGVALLKGGKTWDL